MCMYVCICACILRAHACVNLQRSALPPSLVAILPLRSFYWCWCWWCSYCCWWWFDYPYPAPPMANTLGPRPLTGAASVPPTAMMILLCVCGHVCHTVASLYAMSSLRLLCSVGGGRGLARCRGCCLPLGLIMPTTAGDDGGQQAHRHPLLRGRSSRHPVFRHSACQTLVQPPRSAGCSASAMLYATSAAPALLSTVPVVYAVSSSRVSPGPPEALTSYQPEH
jgi:hypothetical protein